jgi:hypothetical protein
VAGGEIAMAQDVVEALVVGNIQPQSFGDGVVEQDGVHAHLASEFFQLLPVIFVAV